jgi:hypothetical protein
MSLSGQEVLACLERLGVHVVPNRTGGLDLSPGLTRLQAAVVQAHLPAILEAITTSLGRFPCPFCASLTWIAPPRPAPAVWWQCGSCTGYGQMDKERPSSRWWTFFLRFTKEHVRWLTKFPAM